MSRRGSAGRRIVALSAISMLVACGGGPAANNPPQNLGGSTPVAGGSVPSSTPPNSTPAGAGGTQTPPSGQPCWAGKWLSQPGTYDVPLADGSTLHLTGGAGVVVTLQTNTVMMQDFGGGGALNGTADGGPAAVQYRGTELDQLTATGDTSGTMSVKVESGAQFTLVSNGQTTTQVDAVGSVSNFDYTCTAQLLTLTSSTSQDTFLRVG